MKWVVKIMTMCLGAIVGGLSQTVRIQEMMIDPVFSENSGEYVEILNTGNQPVNLSRWSFGDPGDMDVLVMLGDSLVLPGAYGLILDPDYTGEYDEVIPDSTILFMIEDSRFGSYGLSNSTGKVYRLCNAEGKTIDSCFSLTNLSEGYSMERDDDGFWQVSLVAGGTPGFRNSVCRPDGPFLDVSFKEIFCDGYIVTAHISLLNRGNVSSGEWELSFKDSITGQEVYSTGGGEIAAADSMKRSCSWNSPLYGYSNILWYCRYGVAENRGTKKIPVPLPADSLYITEFCPLPADGISCEYIEFYNASRRLVNLVGTTISDLTGTASLAKTDYVLPKLGLRVAAECPDLRQDMQSPPFLVWIPPEWRSLNNGGDAIVWRDFEGCVLDSLMYTSSWNLQSGYGLERRFLVRPAARSDNWVPGFSPGVITVDSLPDRLWKGKLYLINHRADTLTFGVKISNQGCLSGSPPSIDLLAISPSGDKIGFHSFTLTTECEAGDTLENWVSVCFEYPGTWLWTLNGEDLSADTVAVYTPYIRSPVTFSEVMNCPSPQEPAEWIELYSKEIPLILDHWQIQVDQRGIELKGVMTVPYMVITHEKWDQNLPSLPVERFPVLSNSGFVLRLFDPDSNLMDSVNLEGHPDFTTGVSLENPQTDHPFLNGKAWHRSRALRGHSAGMENSIALLAQENITFLSADPRILTQGASEPMMITVRGEKGLSYVEIHIFTLTGNPVTSYEINAFSSPLAQVFWDGNFKNGSPVPLGLYIITAKVRDVDGTKKEGFESVLVNCP
jgi:hypothetical protein